MLIQVLDKLNVLYLSSCENAILAYANVSSIFSENSCKKVNTSCQNNLLELCVQIGVILCMHIFFSICSFIIIK